MSEAISRSETLFGKTAIRICAQLYLESFYASFGFVRASEVFLEDGIQHIEMERPAVFVCR